MLDFDYHFLACRELQGAIPRNPSIQYSDMFAMNLEKQLEVTTLYSQLLAARDKLLLPPERDEPGNDLPSYRTLLEPCIDLQRCKVFLSVLWQSK